MYMPVPDVPSNHSSEDAANVKTAIERMSESLTSLMRRYPRNPEVISVTRYALSCLDENLYQLDLTGIESSSDPFTGDKSPKRPDGESGMFDYLVSFNQPRAPMMSKPSTGGDRSLLGVGMQTSVQIEKLMASDAVIGVWGLDLFGLDKASKHHPLSTIVMGINQRCDMTGVLGLDRRKFYRFVTRIESLYRADPPYHNAIHAADVTNSLFFFMQAANWLELIQPVELFWLQSSLPCATMWAILARTMRTW
ncbi:unnamed protein product [Vitrella brassicaformis CCMP3155]|uniref:PDEase domain-containing protein n=1 Tax=Vitrella brassicaformis (strain CCMP3155) TaxID=1169540 RepID=A0A0G4EUE2_VITBC|nr:unnamed protein product [Vitrella brassicaformis CCMP3155]|eukprot:CEM02043.1 unnamed protein product [Vitrella brassicaformis CCMP3155]